jgi:hypothetical protein
MLIEEEDIDEYIYLMEDTICRDYIDYIDYIETDNGIGYCIPFLTTINYLSHHESRKSLNIKHKDVSKYFNN